MIVATSTCDYDGPGRFDITVKSASEPEGKLLAPTWDMVRGVKDGTLDWNEYTFRYVALVGTRRHSQVWRDLLLRERVVLVCFCPPGRNCHRHLAKTIIGDACTAEGIPFEDGGEIPWNADWGTT